MHLDVIELRRFYYRTTLGRMAQAAIRGAVAAHWPDVKGGNIAAFGFGQPFLRPFQASAQRVVALMPSQMGAFHWPVEGANISVLADERRWPLATGFVDRLLIVHALENSERPGSVLAEAHRVLAPGGRALIIAPNRAGLWARRETTPFGHGRPYSVGQLEQRLREHQLEPIQNSAALYVPPSQRRFWLRLARMAEATGRRLDARRFAGVILVEVVKTAYAAPRSGAAVTTKTRLEVLGGLGRPALKPAPKAAAFRAPRSALEAEDGSG
ncbi:MAG: methyltransferase domain-containing protein [Paracoccaceae bacterium]